MNVTEKQFNYMVEVVVKEMSLLLKEDLGISLPEAISIVLNSDTYTTLLNPDSAFYYQSSRYVYSFLKNELEYGMVG